MANPEHVDIVEKGAAALGTWRQEHPSTFLDLVEADMRRVNLNKSDLRQADLTRANLSEASLREADLRRAILWETDLRGAALGDAVLADAKLVRTELSGARVAGADFRGSEFSEVIFGDVDLSETKGLEGCHHTRPSTVGVDTLFRSKGKIPRVFLQGCGLSDWEIEAAKLYDPTLPAYRITDILYEVVRLRTETPILVGKLFISYTHADRAFVDALEGKLKKNGIRFWRDVHDATAGRLDKIVDRAMRLNPTVLLVLSKHSVESDWVEDEANRARRLEKELKRDVLCPVALDDAWKSCTWSATLRTQIEKYNILPFANWEDAATFEGMFGRLVEGLSIFYRPEQPGP
jgi:uncharacterized protein YjbI with pentapeptide repeats